MRQCLDARGTGSCNRSGCSTPVLCRDLHAGHGSPFKSTVSEVAQDTFCPQAATAVCPPAIDTASDVRVIIAIQKRVNFGERITVVGETDALGRWSPCDGVPLTWSEGDVWSAEVSLQPGLHEFKVRISGGLATCSGCVRACWAKLG